MVVAAADLLVASRGAVVRCSCVLLTRSPDMTPPHSKACDDVEQQKEDEVTTTSTTTKSTRTHQKGHDGVRCTDYNEHDTSDHTCHWCYEKVDSAEYLNGNWLTASFNVLIEKTKAGGKSGNLSPANQMCLLKDWWVASPPFWK